MSRQIKFLKSSSLLKFHVWDVDENDFLRTLDNKPIQVQAFTSKSARHQIKQRFGPRVTLMTKDGAPA